MRVDPLIVPGGVDDVDPIPFVLLGFGCISSICRHIRNDCFEVMVVDIQQDIS
jgi:hypothetical protein